jgi:hypothetical protein
MSAAHTTHNAPPLRLRLRSVPSTVVATWRLGKVLPGLSWLHIHRNSSRQYGEVMDSTSGRG